MDRHEELHTWIARTEQLQKKMGVLFTALAVLALVLLVWNRTVGAFSLVCVSLVAICAFWVTAAHNAAHRQKLAELHRTQGKPVTTAHRRWHAP
jgi:hypothetical protein